VKIGILIFDGMTQLDAMGPFEVFARIPRARVLLVAKRKRAVEAQFGLRMMPHTDLRRCPKLDIICIPGGGGINRLLLDRETVAFVRRQSKRARYVTSVCTGSLLLGAAGLLHGRRATSHWFSVPLLAAFGAKPSQKRIERDGKFVTAGGVTSGIDFALWMAAKVAGTQAAKEIQLMLQYDPKPPFRAGTPAQAGKRLVARFCRRGEKVQAERKALLGRAVKQSLSFRD
jgi:cyclohexyl-isocyanide hydratase